MKNSIKNQPLIYLLLLYTLAACHRHTHDDDDDMNEPTPIEYQDYTVDFFNAHKDFVFRPVVWETITEQVLIRPAHKQGASFEVVTEQILVKPGYKEYRIMDSTILHIVVNSETDRVGEVPCYHFLDEADIVEIEQPAVYKTWYKQALLQNGTGSQIPASYGTVSREVIYSPAKVLPNTEDQTYNRVRFRIPADQSIRAYLDRQFAQQGVVDCVEGNSFRIKE